MIDKILHTLVELHASVAPRLWQFAPESLRSLVKYGHKTALTLVRDASDGMLRYYYKESKKQHR